MKKRALTNSDLAVSKPELTRGESLEISVLVTNRGSREGREVAQLYTRQTVAERSPPVRELKGFRKISLGAGESQRVSFTLEASDLAYHDGAGRPLLDPGTFKVFVGGSSAADLTGTFVLRAP